MNDEAAIQNVSRLVLCHLNGCVTWNSETVARALADAGLLLGAKERACVEACMAIAPLSGVIEKRELRNAVEECYAAGRAVAADRNPKPRYVEHGGALAFNILDRETGRFLTGEDVVRRLNSDRAK